MKLIRLLTLRALRTRPFRFLLSTFGIILGVAGILSMGITNDAAMAAITRLFDDTSGKANLVVVSAGSEGDKIDEGVLKQVGRQAGVATAVPSIQATTLLADEALPTELGLSMFGASNDFKAIQQFFSGFGKLHLSNKQILDIFFHRTLEIIENKWKAVEALADALIEKRSINGKEVSRIIEENI